MCHYCVSKSPQQGKMFHTMLSVATKDLRVSKEKLLKAQKLYLHLGMMEESSLYEEVFARIDACEKLLHCGSLPTRKPIPEKGSDTVKQAWESLAHVKWINLDSSLAQHVRNRKVRK